jgi:hypothetical protein
MGNYPKNKPYGYDENQHAYTPFVNNYQQKKNNHGQNRPVVKHSGAKTTTYHPKTGPNAAVEQHLTTGWRLSKGELIAIKCVTTEKSKLSDKGWFGSIACTMTNTKTGVVAFHWGTMEKKSGKVVIDSMAFVINPKAKNGGYAGTFLKS